MRQEGNGGKGIYKGEAWRERSGKEIEGQEPLPSNFNTPSKSLRGRGNDSK
jgi:hypothetical protein